MRRVLREKGNRGDVSMPVKREFRRERESITKRKLENLIKNELHEKAHRTR